jgi:hypothetical protein
LKIKANIACMGEIINAYKIALRKPEDLGMDR